MIISSVFWWLQYALVVILIHWLGLRSDEVLTIHVFSSPLLLIAMVMRFQSGIWRKFELTS